MNAQLALEAEADPRFPSIISVSRFVQWTTHLRRHIYILARIGNSVAAQQPLGVGQ